MIYTLKFLNLTGSINVGNAEKLDFPDNYFDIVYSPRCPNAY